MKTIVAKYPGKCLECRQPIKPGDRIKYYGRLRAEHETCSGRPSRESFVPDAFDLQVEDNMRDACGL